MIERSPDCVEQKEVYLQGFLFFLTASEFLRLKIFCAEVRFFSRPQKAVDVLANFKEKIACLFKVSDIFLF